MTGSLQTKSGKYYAVVNYYDEAGKRKQKWISSGLEAKGNKRKAELFLSKTLAEYRGFDIQPCKDVQYSDFTLKWLEIAAKSIEPNTTESYLATINRYIKPHFAETKISLQELKPSHIQDFYEKLSQKGLSASTVLNVHANVRKSLEYAVRMNLISYNPSTRCVLPKREKYHASYYNAKEINKMLDVFKKEDMYPAVLLAAFYGLRRSEIMSLKWQSVDFENSTFTVKDVVVKCGATKYIDKSRTKTKSSHRTLPLSPAILEYFYELRCRQEKNSKTLGTGYAQNDYVCVRADGSPFPPDYITRKFSKVLKGAGLPHIRFHDLRHSAASMLIKEGHDMFEISKWLGHGNITTTANIYSHLGFEAKVNMANTIGQKLEI